MPCFCKFVPTVTVQLFSRVWRFVTHGPQHARLSCASPFPGVRHAIQPSHPLSSSSPPAFNLSQHQGLFQQVSSSHQVVKVMELQLQNKSFQWIFKTDFLYDWLVGFPCSPRDSQESSPTPQKASFLWHSAFLMIQFSHPYITTGKIIVLTLWTFVGKVMSLLFNMVSRIVIASLSRSKCLHFMAAVTICSDFGAQENSLSLFPLFPHLFVIKWWDQMPCS